MTDLDDLTLVSKLDPDGFLESVEKFPEQLKDAYQRALQVEGLPAGANINSIAVLGMGGSGISGDASRVVLGNDFPKFVQTLKGYDLPAWVGEGTLVFAMSYSGETEETLNTFDEAQRRGAFIVTVTTGGSLASLSNAAGYPVVEIAPGLLPRAAFGYLTIPILAVIDRMDVGPKFGDDIAEAIGLMERRSAQFSRDVPAEMNRAKDLALRLLGRIPIVYGSEGLAEVAAYRWKCQFNECSKTPAWWHSFPELNHNEVVGWNQLESLTRESVAIIVLRHEGEHERIKKRIDLTLPLIQRNVAFVRQVRSEGSSRLARLFDLTYFGDFVGTYLALAQGVDPAPVAIIQELKKRLAEPD